MIYIGLGSNLPVSAQLTGRALLTAALDMVAEKGIEIRLVSEFYLSEPVPVSDQDWYVNAAAEIATSLDPVALLQVLHEVERQFGRARSVANAARTLDLDLLDYSGLIRAETGPAPHLPHPRMAARAFVLYPLRDIAPDWCHPTTGASLSTLITQLTPLQKIEPLGP